MKFSLSNIFSTIRLILICLILIYVFNIIRLTVRKFDNAIPRMDYQTVFVERERIVSQPDTVIRWFERIVQVPAKPETVYQNVLYPNIQNLMVNYIKADGKKIEIREQYCDSLKGRILTYPYYQYFQFVPPKSMTFYIDYWDWDRLVLEASYPDFEVRAVSELWFNPWRLSMGIYGSNKGKFGVRLKKKLL